MNKVVMSDIRCLHAARAVLRVAGLLGVPTGVRDFDSLDLETAPGSEHAYGTRKRERVIQKWKQFTASQQQWQMSSPIAARLEAALTNGRDALTELCWYRPWWVSLRLLMAGYGKGPNRKAKMLIAWCISWMVYTGLRPCQNWRRQHKNYFRCSIKPTKSSVCALEICCVHTVTPPSPDPPPPKAWARTDEINQTPEDWHRSSTWGLKKLVHLMSSCD